MCKQENKTKLREKELEYLRTELNQRVIFSYEHSHKLFGYIMVVWGGTLVLLGNARQDSLIRLETILFIMATVFFISVVVLYLLSQRNSDNMDEISKLAAYITIFYEGTPEKTSTDEKPSGIFWELATLEIHKKDKKKSLWRKTCNKLKNEYFWLSLIAMGVITVVLFLMLDSFNEKVNNSFKTDLACSFEGKITGSSNKNKVEIKIKGSSEEKVDDHFNLTIFPLMFWGCFIYIAISAFLSVATFDQLSLNWEDWDDKKRAYSKLFLNYARDIKHYDGVNFVERFGVDFCRDIKYKPR